MKRNKTNSRCGKSSSKWWIEESEFKHAEKISRILKDIKSAYEKKYLV